MARGLRFDCFARLEFREQKKPHCFQLTGRNGVISILNKARTNIVQITL